MEDLDDDFGWGVGGDTAAMPAAPAAAMPEPPAAAEVAATPAAPAAPAAAVAMSSLPSTTLSSRASSVASMTDTTACQFSLLGLLGRGAFASCYLATRHACDGEESSSSYFVAVKRFTTPLSELGEAEEAAVRAEVDALKALSAHRNITTYHGCFVDDNGGTSGGSQREPIFNMGPMFSLVVEYCDGGTLESLVAEHKTTNTLLSAPRVWEIFLQCLDALKHIHSLKIIHRDLKPANILLQGSARRIVKLADFGVSSLAKTMATTVTGTPLYLCPEICEGAPYDTKADIWSLGCVYRGDAAIQRRCSQN